MIYIRSHTCTPVDKQVQVPGLGVRIVVNEGFNVVFIRIDLLYHIRGGKYDVSCPYNPGRQSP